MLTSLRSALLGFICVSGAALADTDLTEFDHQPWNDLLAEHVMLVRDGVASEVDYRGFAADRTTLRGYLDELAGVSRDVFDAWERDEQLAFLINAYNAWTVELILTAYPDLESIRDLGNIFSSPWSKKIAPLLDQQRSLDEIEHELIRGSGRYNEPRIHFAVNCASIGCPALLPEAFRSEQLEAQLEKATRAFLADKTRNRFQNGKLEVSSIFKWYREDFKVADKPSSGLAEYLAGYAAQLGLNEQQMAELAAGQLKIKFLNYDWKLNDRS